MLVELICRARSPFLPQNDTPIYFCVSMKKDLVLWTGLVLGTHHTTGCVTVSFEFNCSVISEQNQRADTFSALLLRTTHSTVSPESAAQSWISNCSLPRRKIDLKPSSDNQLCVRKPFAYPDICFFSSLQKHFSLLWANIQPKMKQE